VTAYDAQIGLLEMLLHATAQLRWHHQIWLCISSGMLQSYHFNTIHFDGR